MFCNSQTVGVRAWMGAFVGSAFAGVHGDEASNHFITPSCWIGRVDIIYIYIYIYIIC